MSKKSYIQATIDVFREEMKRDENVILFGEDITLLGGPFGDTKGLVEEFGDRRVRNTPISECAIVGMGIGAAAAGLRPIAQLMFVDFAFVAADQILNQAAKLHYMSGGKMKLPLVIRTQQGIGGNHSGQHSQSLEAIFMHVPGLKVALPSSPADAAGLLRTAIRDDNPVMIIDHKGFYFRNMKSEVPDDSEFMIPFGKANVIQEGSDVTVVATQLCVQKSVEAAKQVGISCEIIDPRTMVPLDVDTIVRSVKKTGRLVVAHEAITVAGPGAEIVRLVVEECFGSLQAAPIVVGSQYCTVPYSHVLEEAMIPQINDIASALVRVTKGV
ncbi:MAG: alpha-ketoacid dehydrogenase subunit beta [Christensenellales bacterium]|jgi:pyruvate/2-oxoglutarate/acetoin dehydrogenase E1 component